MCPTRVGWLGMLQVPSLLPRQGRTNPQGSVCCSHPGQLRTCCPGVTELRAHVPWGSGGLCVLQQAEGDTALAINLLPAPGDTEPESPLVVAAAGWALGLYPRGAHRAGFGLLRPLEGWHSLFGHCQQGVPAFSASPERATCTGPTEFPVLPSLPCSRGEEGGLKAET